MNKLKKREEIINDYNNAQSVLETIIETTNFSQTSELRITTVLQGDLDFSILKTKEIIISSIFIETPGEITNLFNIPETVTVLAPPTGSPGTAAAPCSAFPGVRSAALLPGAPGLRSTPPNNTRRTSSHTRTPWAGAPLLSQRPGRVLLSMPRAQNPPKAQPHLPHTHTSGA